MDKGFLVNESDLASVYFQILRGLRANRVKQRGSKLIYRFNIKCVSEGSMKSTDPIARVVDQLI